MSAALLATWHAASPLRFTVGMGVAPLENAADDLEAVLVSALPPASGRRLPMTRCGLMPAIDRWVIGVRSPSAPNLFQYEARVHVVSTR